MERTQKLHLVEEDFIEFIAWKRQVSEEQIEHELFALKKHFRFESVGFRDLTEQVQVLHTIFFGFAKPADIVATYTFHAYLSVLRHMSYSYQHGLPLLCGEGLYFLKLLMRGEGQRAWCSLKRKLTKMRLKNTRADLLTLIQERFAAPIIVDYGCGLGDLTLKIARTIPNTRCLLVDIPSIMNEFTAFRFRKYQIPFELIPITPTNFYPELPPHNVCIADEVIEHLPEPLAVLRNICNALEHGGILYGDYSDHCPELFHIHTSLEFFREALCHDFTQLADKIYLKK